MNVQKNVFKYADAWILLAIIYASKTGVATLSKIIDFGDAINHAIFTMEELEGGLFRLIDAGYISESEDGYKITKRTNNLFSNFSLKNKSVLKHINFIRNKLNSPLWSEDYNPAFANEGVVYERINKDVYERAYTEYMEKMGQNK